jgi:hypothetical protein
MSSEQDLDVNELPENSTHSFVVKIWLEEKNAETGSFLWRGYIIHVRSRKRRYIKTLDEISDFINNYVDMMGLLID